MIELIIRINPKGLNKYEVATALLNVADQIVEGKTEVSPGVSLELQVKGFAGYCENPYSNISKAQKKKTARILKKAMRSKL